MATIDKSDPELRDVDVESRQDIFNGGGFGIVLIGDFETVVTKSCKKFNSNFQGIPVFDR